MLYQYFGQVIRIDIKRKILTLDTTGVLPITIRNAKPAAFIIHESVERDGSLRTQVKLKILYKLQRPGNGEAFFAVSYCRYTIRRFMIFIVMPEAPSSRLIVKTGDVAVY